MDATAGIVQLVVFLVWTGTGIYLAHRSRQKGWGYKIMVYIFFTKGTLFYLFFYYAPYNLFRTIKAFVLGLREGQEEKERGEQQDKNTE